MMQGICGARASMLSLPIPLSPNAKPLCNFKNSAAFNHRPGFSMPSRLLIRPLAYSSSENGLKEGSVFGNITEALPSFRLKLRAMGLLCIIDAVNLVKEQGTSRSKAFALSGTADTLTKTGDDYGEASASGRFIAMSPDKARRIIDQIRGRPYEEALMILELMPYRGCYPIFKLVYSAAANASHNLGLDKTSLVISEAFVDGGPVKKRFSPRARGRGDTIRKPTCHIKVVVKDTSLYEE